MQIPLQITYRHMAPSPALEARLRARAAKLEACSAPIARCLVVLERRAKPQDGDLFSVHLEVRIPGRSVVVNREHAQDVHLAVRDAFDAVVRRLQAVGEDVRSGA